MCGVVSMLRDTTYLVVPVAGGVMQRSLPAHARAVDERAVPQQQPRHGQVPAVTRLVQRGPSWPVFTAFTRLDMTIAGRTCVVLGVGVRSHPQQLPDHGHVALGQDSSSKGWVGLG